MAKRWRQSITAKRTSTDRGDSIKMQSCWTYDHHACIVRACKNVCCHHKCNHYNKNITTKKRLHHSPYAIGMQSTACIFNDCKTVCHHSICNHPHNIGRLAHLHTHAPMQSFVCVRHTIVATTQKQNQKNINKSQ